MSGLAPKLPLASDSGTGYKLLQTLPEVIQQNLKNLVLTVPGERMMDPEFGIGLSKYLFEQNNPLLHAQITQKIEEQVKVYLPYINILGVFFSNPDNDVMAPDNEANTLRVRIQYFIKPLSIEDVLDLIP